MIIQIALSPIAKARLQKRIANVRWSLLEQAEYRAMQSAVKPVTQAMRWEWAQQTYKRKGTFSHRFAIVAAVGSKITRRGGVNVVGTIGVRRRGQPTKVAIVNVLDPGFNARNGKYVPGRHVRAKVFATAAAQAAKFKQYIEAAALKMLSGK